MLCLMVRVWRLSTDECWSIVYGRWCVMCDMMSRMCYVRCRMYQCRWCVVYNDAVCMFHDWLCMRRGVWFSRPCVLMTMYCLCCVSHDVSVCCDVVMYGRFGMMCCVWCKSCMYCVRLMCYEWCCTMDDGSWMYACGLCIMYDVRCSLCYGVVMIECGGCRVRCWGV